MLLLPFAYAEDEVTENTVAESAVTENAAMKNSEPEVKVVKTSADYSDLKVLPQELQDQFNFFIREGALVQEKEDWFGANSPITREEFVKVARAALSPTSNEALTKPAYIEAFVSLGLTNSEGGVVDWDKTVSRQDLAKFLIYGIGKGTDARKVTPTTDLSFNNLDKVDKAASRFVTLALQLKIVKNQEDDNRYHGDSVATRKMLVESASAAKKINTEITDASKVSIVEAKAVGARKVGITFNKMLDSEKTNKIKLILKKDGSEIAGVTEWSADNKTAAITVEMKLKKGSYSVELSGLDDASVEKKTAEFTAEDEQFKSLEFVNTSDTLPRSKVTIDFKQMNQYGEETDLRSNRFEISAGSRNTPQNVVGKQAFKLDLSKEKRDSGIHISIFDRENKLTLSKSFKIGDQAIVSKIDLGDLTYKNERQFLMPGNIAYLSFSAFDQYGFRMDDVEELNHGIALMYDGERLFEKNKELVFVDYDHDGYLELELQAFLDMQKDTASTLKLMAVGSGQIASKKITVFTPKEAASVAIKEYTSTLAEEDVDKVIELEIRDSEGTLFEADQKVELIKANKIKVRSTGAIELGSPNAGEEGQFILSGSNRGNIGVSKVTGTGEASIEVTLTELNKKATAEYTLKKKREPELLEKSDFDPAFVYTIIQGKDTTPKFIVKDQYDEEYLAVEAPDYQVRYELKRTGGDAGAFTGEFTGTGKFKLNDTVQSVRVKLSDAYGKGIKLVAAANKLGSYQMTATLLKVKQDSSQPDATKWAVEGELNSHTARVESYTMALLDEDLTYSLEAEKSLFAVGKYLVDQGLKVNKNSNDKEQKADQDDAAFIFTNRDSLTKGMSIVATNKDGVATPISGVSILSVQIADPNIVALNSKTKPTKIVGLNPGNTTALITFTTPDGPKTLKENFTVWSSNLTLGSELKVGRTSNTTIFTNEINDRYIWDSKLLIRIAVKDDLENEFYNTATGSGSTFKNNEGLTPFMGSLLTEFILSDVTYKNGTPEANKDTFYMTEDYKLVFQPKSGSDKKLSDVNLQSFKLTVRAGNKTVERVFTLK
jgi:hypothetical protein